jgi:hypothetical protein
MSALSRLRPFAAALALLLFLSTNAAAWTDKPMDTPGGPPVPNPQEVGDPDQPGGNIVVFVYRWVFVARLPHGFLRPSTIQRPSPKPLVRYQAVPTQVRGRNAR